MDSLATAPVHSLPWYMGAAFFGAWAAASVGLALLARRWLRARAERRADELRSRSRGRSMAHDPAIRDDRSLPAPGDLEPL